MLAVAFATAGNRLNERFLKTEEDIMKHSMTTRSAEIGRASAGWISGALLLAVATAIPHVGRAADPITQIWLTPVGIQPSGTPSIGDDGTIYFGTPGGVLAFNPNGTEKWHTETSGHGLRKGGVVPLPGGDVVYVSIDGWVTRRDSTGGIVFSEQRGYGTSHAIAVSDEGVIYHGDRGGNVFASNPDGSLKWAFDTGDEIYGGPSIGKIGTIYCGSNDGRLFAINPDGSKRWDLDLGSPVQVPPTIGGDGVIYAVSYDSRLHAISPAGIELWYYQGANYQPEWQPAIAADGTIYFVTSNYLYALNPNGTLKWSYTTDQGFRTPVVLEDGSMYVAGSNGKMVHLEPNGAERRDYRSNFGNTPPVVGLDGTIYTGHADNSFAALAGGLAPAETPWPMFQHDSKLTGRVPPLPETELVLPVNASTYVSGHVVPVRAEVYNISPVDRVDFYRGGTLLSADSTPPYTSSWASSGTAAQTFSAVARSGSLSITSAPATINLLSSRPNALPVVQITSPTNNSSPLAGRELKIAAQASDPDGAVVSVEFFDGNTSLGTATYPGFAVTIDSLAEGEHLFTAVATDNYGGQKTSTVVRAFAVQENWRIAVQYPQFATPSLGLDGSILAGSSEWFYAFNSQGEEIWKFHLNGEAVSTAAGVADDGTIYFGGSDGNLYSLTPTGSSNWVYKTNGRIGDTPAVAEDGTVYVGSWDGKFYAINPDGTKRWDYASPVAGNTAPAFVDGGIILIPGGSGDLVALDTDGNFQWSFPVDGSVSSTPAIGADGTIYFGSANTGKFFALDPDGNQVWMLPISSGVSGASPSIGPDGAIYCGTNEGELVAIRPNGTLKWTRSLGIQIGGTPAFASDGTLYVGSHAKKLFHYDPNGTKIWEFDAEFSIATSPMIMDSGDVIFTTPDRLLSLKGTSPPAVGPWPTYMQNRQRTGRAWTGAAPILTSPEEAALFAVGDAVPLQVDLSGAEGSITKVEYLANSNVVRIALSAPFSASWNAPGGVHHVQARSTDLQGVVRTSESVRIKVVPPSTPPSILAGLSSMTTITNGSGVTLFIDVFGTPPLTYTWYKDGVPIPGAEGAAYHLDSTSVADAARYHVVVSNAHGSIQSGESVLSVLQPVVVRWTSSPGTGTTSPTVGKGGIIQYGNRSGDQFAYDPRGNFEWWWQADLVPNGDARISDPIYSTSAIDNDGVAHFLTRSGVYYRVNADGTENARTPQVGGDSSPALGTNGTVYLGSGASLRAYSPGGNLLWSAPVTGPLNSAPAIGTDGTVYVTSDGVHVGNNLFSGSLTAFTPGGGFKWTFVAGDFVTSSPALGADGTIYFGSRDQKFYAVNPNGTKRWEFPTDGPVYGSAVVASDGTIYFGNSGSFIPEIGIRKGHLHALNPNGQLKWSFQADEEIRSTPVLAEDGTIYFGADDWYVYALNPNGTLRWKHRTLGKVQSGLSIGFDGTVYATSLDTRLYALFENPSPLAKSPWPKFKHDPRNTGNASTSDDPAKWVYPFASNAFNNGVDAILVQGDDIYVGGRFTIAGGRLANYVARWDGHRWSPLGAGVDGLVTSLAWYNGELYVAGNFSQAGGQNIRFLARWNGTSWSAVGPQLNEYVKTLAVHQGLLYVGGNFNQLGGAPVGSILTWNGSEFSDTGLGSPSRTTALASLNGELYAGVTSLGPPEDRSYGVVRRTASGWEEFGRGLNNDIWTLAMYNGQLHVGGQFTAADGVPVVGIARRNGNSWEALPKPLDYYLFPTVSAMVVLGGELYVTGGFLEAGEIRANNIARWNGTSWAPLGTGLTGGNLSTAGGGAALTVQGNSLLVGGGFLAANGNREIRYFARWKNGNFESLGEKLSYQDGVFRLTLFPDWGATYGIERSEDLTHWERIITYTNLLDAVEFIDTNPAQNGRRFYRAVSP